MVKGETYWEVLFYKKNALSFMNVVVVTSIVCETTIMVEVA